MVQIKINHDKIIEGNTSEEGIFLEGAKVSWDIQSLDKNSFHILRNNISYLAEVIFFDQATKEYKIKINNVVLDIQLKDEHDLLIEKLGWNTNTSSSITEIKAPMPGLILSVIVSEGQEVNPGDPLIILEAMKMENIIKSPAKASVKSIEAVKGQSVEKNQVLIRF